MLMSGSKPFINKLESINLTLFTETTHENSQLFVPGHSLVIPLVMPIEILNTDGEWLLAEISLEGQTLGVMDCFSMLPEEHIDLLSLSSPH